MANGNEDKGPMNWRKAWGQSMGSAIGAGAAAGALAGAATGPIGGLIAGGTTGVFALGGGLVGAYLGHKWDDPYRSWRPRHYALHSMIATGPLTAVLFALMFDLSNMAAVPMDRAAIFAVAYQFASVAAYTGFIGSASANWFDNLGLTKLPDESSRLAV